jgi:DNA invertase Pin-like site-specific DNA recombinase
MIIGYIRVSTDKQTVSNQRNEILEYAHRNKIQIDDFIEVEVSSRKTIEERKLHLLQLLKSGDTVIASELSRFGRSVSELLTLVNELTTKKINLIFVKQNMKLDSTNTNDIANKVLLNTFALLAELERDMISQRTKEALKARKAQGVILGKPKGSIQKSIFDKHKDSIVELLGYGVPISKIVKSIGVGTRQSLGTYIKKRSLQ